MHAHTYTHTHTHTHKPLTYSEFQESRCVVASPLSIDYLSEQKLLQRLAVGKDTGVLQLRGKGRNCTALCHSNLEYYAKMHKNVTGTLLLHVCTCIYIYMHMCTVL